MHLLKIVSIIAVTAMANVSLSYAQSSRIETPNQFGAFLEKHILKWSYGLWFNTRQPLETSVTDYVARNPCSGDALKGTYYSPLINSGFLQIKLPGELKSGGFGKDPVCQFQVMAIDQFALGAGNVEEVGNEGWFKVPLVQQKLISIEEFGFGHFGRNQPCTLRATALLENYEPSEFAIRNSRHLKSIKHLAKIFQKNVVGEFCGTPLDDGTMKWRYFDRMYQ